MKHSRFILALCLMVSFLPFVCVAQGIENSVVTDDIIAGPEIPPLPVEANPRIMIITVEYADGIEQPASITQSRTEEKFIANDFPLVDKSQMEMIKEKDAVLSFSDPNKAAALGRNYGADIVVVVEAKSNLIDTTQPYGVSVFAYECNAAGKAIKVDTAEVITSRSSDAVERGGGRIPTANKACESAVLTLADMLINDINESIKNEAYEETTVQIVLANADYAKVKALTKALDEQRSIKAVDERSLELNVAIIDVELLGSADSLAELLITMQNGPVLRVTGKTQNRIDAEF
ncbi:MAG: hypothetical protein Q8R48_06890, partial [Candidatus Omnitrophota bacterium]|nr:hypothetical protein [Candidatus Omnitrophota bacterium]